jgi:Carbohydrate binding domain
MALYVNNTRPSIRPSLSLDFAGSRTVDNRITFTRSSSASYFSNNQVQYANNNVPRINFDSVNTGTCLGLLIEESRTNLFTWYQANVSTGWGYQSGDVITPNACTAPDGTFSGIKLSLNSYASGDHIGVGTTQTIGTTYTFSAWMRADSPVTAGISIGRASGNPSVQQTVSLTTNWQRFSVTYTLSTNTTLYCNFYGSNVTYYVWGLQVEAGNFATSYIPILPSFSSRSSFGTYIDSTGVLRIAGVNQARYGYAYDSASSSWKSQGLILESAATNILYDSNLYGNTISTEAIYTKTNNSTDVTAPDGSDFTTKLVTGTTGNTWYWRIPSAGTFATNTTYTVSVWIRTASGTGTWSLQQYPYGSGTLCNVTTQWQRFSNTFTTDASGTQPYIGLVSPSSSTTFYVWGWQAETGSIATSYIPTYGATATRSADVATSGSTTRAKDFAQITSGTNFTSWYNQNQSTMYVEADISGVTTNGSAVFDLYCFGSYGVEAISAGVSNTTPTVAPGRSAVGGTTVLTASTGTLFKVAHTFDKTSGNHYMVGNGGTVQGPAGYGVPYQDSLTIGDSPNVSLRTYNGHIRKIAYYPAVLTATTIQLLTS